MPQDGTLAVRTRKKSTSFQYSLTGSLLFFCILVQQFLILFVADSSAGKLLYRHADHGLFDLLYLSYILDSDRDGCSFYPPLQVQQWQSRLNDRAQRQLHQSLEFLDARLFILWFFRLLISL